ncbi:MAG: mechanosensitive ion channel domain-containing protein [Thermoanaerobaculia bacterium]
MCSRRLKQLDGLELGLGVHWPKARQNQYAERKPFHKSLPSAGIGVGEDWQLHAQAPALAFSRPFKVDDIIQSRDFKGTVRGIEMRHTHIRTADGRDIFLPNSQIINNPLTNFTRDGLLRPVFTVGIDYADNARVACGLLRKAAQGVPGVAAKPPASAVIAGLDSSWVQLEVALSGSTPFKKASALPRFGPRSWMGVAEASWKEASR